MANTEPYPEFIRRVTKLADEWATNPEHIEYILASIEAYPKKMAMAIAAALAWRLDDGASFRRLLFDRATPRAKAERETGQDQERVTTWMHDGETGLYHIVRLPASVWKTMDFEES
jgi:hypothetical protein